MADNVTTDELEDALKDLLVEVAAGTKEYAEGTFLDLVTYATDKSEVLARLNAIDLVDADDDIESLAEKLASAYAVISNDEGELQAILDMINTNKADLATTNTTIATLRGEYDTTKAKAIANENAIAVLNGDDQTEGSVAKAVLDATGGDIDALKDSVTVVEGKVTVLEDTLNDTEDADGNTVTGVVTRLANTRQAVTEEIAAREAAVTAAITEAKGYCDDNKLKADSMDILGIINTFRTGLGLAEKSDGDAESV